MVPNEFPATTAVITIVFDAPAVKEAVTSGLLLIALARPFPICTRVFVDVVVTKDCLIPFIKTS